MTIARWRPSRAGVVNVHQYEDETLHFAGGRSLLRGVNASGRCTAMNMLLPFLLEADTRKSDATWDRVRPRGPGCTRRAATPPRRLRHPRQAQHRPRPP